MAHVALNQSKRSIPNRLPSFFAPSTRAVPKSDLVLVTPEIAVTGSRVRVRAYVSYFTPPLVSRCSSASCWHMIECFAAAFCAACRVC